MVAEETKGFFLNIGASYRCKSTGTVFVLEGLRSKRRVCLIHDAKGQNREVRDYVPVDDLEAGYEYVGCDHVDHCCTRHRVHVSPHRGCMMR
ncbi:hypothetical protein ACMX2H_11510 [Arthrobacter sulfonylureivorans]|uniref:hypothetical protein n=1 Tax=Arthrobacter sulfonylureivorans TaxID=2486855 RepID=UPI0039E27AF6